MSGWRWKGLTNPLLCAIMIPAFLLCKKPLQQKSSNPAEAKQLAFYRSIANPETASLIDKCFDRVSECTANEKLMGSLRDKILEENPEQFFLKDFLQQEDAPEAVSKDDHRRQRGSTLYFIARWHVALTGVAYGNFCGKGHIEYQGKWPEPKDKSDLDAQCEKHDRCYAKLGERPFRFIIFPESGKQYQWQKCDPDFVANLDIVIAKKAPTDMTYPSPEAFAEMQGMSKPARDLFQLKTKLQFEF